MICRNCNTPNDGDNTFCINCGNSVTAENIAALPTIPNFTGDSTVRMGQPANSTETAVVNMNRPHFTPQMQFASPTAAAPTRSKNPLIFLIVGIVIVMVLGTAAYLIAMRAGTIEALPDHLGMFAQTDAKDRIDEIHRQDFASVGEAKSSLAKNDSLPTIISHPNLILYADSKDLPVNDVRLVQLDTIKEDGTMKTLDFQIAPVENKPDMKRMRIPDGLANGKYAFALFDSYFNEGKHKFWPFQVRESAKSENGDTLKSFSVNLKPVPPAPPPPRAAPPAPTMNVAPPSPGNTAVSITNDLILRSGPSQTYPKIRDLGRGESVTILSYSSNTESFKGRSSPYAQVRTMNGQIGWVFSAYLR